MLQTLLSAGHKMTAVTSKRAGFAQRMIERQGLTRYFDVVYGSTPDGLLDDKSKLLRVAINERANGSRMLMVGDRKEDVIAASANGIESIGVLWGYGNYSELSDAGAGQIAATPEDLARLLGA